MDNVLYLDFETASVSDLETVGLDNYASDPTTRVLLCAYTFGDRAPKLWQPHLGPIPSELEDALLDPLCQVWAWNSSFERVISKKILGIERPIDEWKDPMIIARSLSLPGSLDEAGEIL